MNKVYPATMRDGTEYTGNQQFAGMGVVKWCAICNNHKSQLGGTIRQVMGGRHWVCAKHAKPGVK